MAKTKTAANRSAGAKKKATPAKATSPKAAAAKAKAAPKKKTASKASPKAGAKAGQQEVKLDRRRTQRREATAEAKSTESKSPAPAKLERRAKVNRRRQIDPTTCERDYSDAEVQFMNAMDDYKRKSGRMFPTCSEVLEVIRGLGYVQLSAAEMAARDSADPLDEQAELEANQALEDSEELRVREEEFAGADA